MGIPLRDGKRGRGGKEGQAFTELEWRRRQRIAPRRIRKDYRKGT